MIKDKRVNSPYKSYSQGNLSQIIIRSLVVPEIQGVSRNSQSFEFVHVDSLTTLQAFLYSKKTHT